MNTTFEAFAGFLLTGIFEGTLSDALIYEFIAKCYECIQEETEILWAGNVEELWNYLLISRTAPASDEQDVKTVFQQGQIFAAMEFVKMMQEKREAESVLEDDARYYGEHWYPVFAALGNGKSLTHGELAAASGLSESSLSQFLHKIERRYYISSRKVGRTKYYRLSSRGQRLLTYMPKKPIYNEYGFETQLISNALQQYFNSYGYSDKFSRNHNIVLSTFSNDSVLVTGDILDDPYAGV